jgi:hypothetical protein
MSASTTPPKSPAALGGLTICWLLGEDPRAITTKNGDRRTVIELRDPVRLSNSMVLWLDGEADAFAGVQPGSAIAIHVRSVRSGRARGELVADTDRDIAAAAFARVREAGR